MKNLLIINTILVLGCFFQTNIVKAQQNEIEIIEPVNLNGPRIGFTIIGKGELADELKSSFDTEPFITQFGWQFETRFFTLPTGVAGLVEAVLLIGGLEQNVFLPSASFLVGIRSAKGVEFGFGPNVSLSGAAFVFAAGLTLQSNSINFPINIAVVPSPKGIRISLLLGFNARRH
ncbi:MAG: hypothetical protein B6I20_01735 [Bacteroidetes bacterium 4572_117]|nr:MAG: hypothetical protein B6I20_01735 [Bacteroidetes bacterium 4572_117]